MEGVVPRQKPRQPSVSTTSRAMRSAPLRFPAVCMRVLTRSVGLHTAAANEPLSMPAAILRPTPDSGASAPSACLTGPYRPMRVPAGR